jgi:uncharacterized membrane protein (DUF2068 family)
MQIDPEPKNVAVTPTVTVAEPPPKRAPTLYFIVAFKLFKGVAALLLALGAYSLNDNNLPDEFHRLLEFLHIDPEKRFFLDIADRLSEVTASNLNWLAVISIVYALFMLLQALGLALRVSWGVWLVILESGFFIPIEIMDLIHRHTGPETHRHLPKIGVAIVLAANVAIVWYLFKNRERIIKHHESH